MILHLIPDMIFSNAVIEQFENSAPKRNIYLVFKYKPEKTKINYPEILTIYNQKEHLINLNLFLKKNNIKSVMVHFLDPEKALIVKKLPNYIQTFWSCFGQDSYPLFYQNSNFKIYSRLTDTTLNASTTKSKYNLIKKIFRLIVPSKPKKNIKLIRKVAKRFDFISCIIPSELDKIKKYLNPKIKYYQFHYIDKETNVRDSPLSISGDNILIGNSNFPANNHLDIFQILHKYHPSLNRKIICPLNYSWSNYTDHIIKEGKRFFGNNFFPLTKSLEIENYKQTISTCRYFIMYSFQQQALGNIQMMLNFGAKVFLSKKNPIYLFFKKNNVTIHSIEDDLIKTPNAFTPLSKDEIENNKKALDKIFNLDKAIERSKQIANLLLLE